MLYNQNHDFIWPDDLGSELGYYQIMFWPCLSYLVWRPYPSCSATRTRMGYWWILSGPYMAGVIAIIVVWTRHGNMSPCIGSRVNTNYERIAWCAGCQLRTRAQSLTGNSSVTHARTYTHARTFFCMLASNGTHHMAEIIETHIWYVKKRIDTVFLAIKGCILISSTESCHSGALWLW